MCIEHHFQIYKERQVAKSKRAEECIYVHANLGCYGYPMGAWPVCVHMYIGAGGVR